MRLLSGFLLPCLLLNALSALAIFKDEAYNVDWHIPLIGPSIPASTFFHHPDVDSRASLIYTLTSRSVLAAINPKDGGLVWRQQLVGSARNGIARGGNGVIVSVMGTKVASFNAANGRLVWESSFSSKAVDLRVTAENAAVVLFEDGTVRLLAEETGDAAWEWKGLDHNDAPISLHLTKTEVTVASSQDSKLHLTTLSLASGAPSSSASSIPAPVDIPSKHQALHGDDVLSWTEASGRILKFLPLGPNPSPISTDIPDDVVETSVLALNNRIVVQFRTHAESWADLYRVDPKTRVASKLYSLYPRVGTHSAFSLSSSGDLTYLVWTLPTGETILYDSRHPEILASYTLPEAHHINVTHAISEVVPRSDGRSFAVRTFLSSSNPGFAGNTHLIRNGELAWTRKESLSSIVASTWVELLDLATEEIVDDLNVETHTSIGAAYIHRVKRHLHELFVYGPDWLKLLPHRIYSAFLAEEVLDNESSGKWRDFFGFRKYTVVVTAEGGLAAIDVGKSGEVVWQASLVLAGGQFKGVAGIYEVRKGVVGIVTIGGEYAEYNAFEGTLLLHESLDVSVRATALVDLPENKVVVALLETEESVVLPLGTNSGPEPVYLTIQESSRAVKGIRVSGSSLPATTWRFVPPASEEITSLVTRPAHDPVASIGKVLGDRSVMYKYLNQHLLVIATLNPVLSTASVYLLDAISGAILHSVTHTGVDTTQAITATVSENWVVYTFFGDNDVTATTGGAKGYQLVVLELYESEFKNDRGPLADANTVSSFTGGGGKPHVISQSYIFPHPITTFAVTSTKQGITSREVLALLPASAGICSIPKRVLDPRRPIGRDLDAAEKEEGLFRYAPVIDIDPKTVITHERAVVGLNTITTSPSQLESTTLVFAYGGDLFGTRMAPSMPFDLLGKTFGKLQLVLTVVALAVGAAVVAPIVRRKQINSRWTVT